MSKRISLIIIAMASLGVLLACGSTANNGSVVSNGGSTSAKTNATAAPAAHFKVGQVVAVGDTWQITINSAKAAKSSNDFEQPKSGNTDLVIDATFKNTSGQAQTLSTALSASLQDATGQKYDQTFVSDLGTAPDGNVNAGSQVRGQIVFEVPLAQHAYTFSFQNDVLQSGAVVWDLTA